MTRFAVVAGQVASDLESVDLTVAGETRTPSGAIVIGSYSQNANATADGAGLSIGYTDFADQAFCAMHAQHGVVTTDNTCRHGSTAVMAQMNPGLTTLDREFVASAVTGGLRLVPDTDGAQYRVLAVPVFAAECKAFSAGNGTVNGATFSITHGLSGKPNLAFFSMVSAHDGANTQGDACLGCMVDTGTIVQRSLGIRMQNAQANGENHGTLFTTRCGHIQANSNSTLSEITVTANDATSTTFTVTGNTLAGELIGLLIYAPDVDVTLMSLDSPNSTTADWAVTSAGFEPQFALLAMSNLISENAGVNDNATAGSFGIAAFDTDTVGSVSIANANGISPSDTASRIATEIFLMDDANANQYRLASAGEAVFNNDGFTVSSADVDLVSVTTHKWFGLFVEAATTDSALNTDYSGIMRGAGIGVGRGL